MVRAPLVTAFVTFIMATVTMVLISALATKAICTLMRSSREEINYSSRSPPISLLTTTTVQTATTCVQKATTTAHQATTTTALKAMASALKAMASMTTAPRVTKASIQTLSRTQPAPPTTAASHTMEASTPRASTA